MFLSIWMNVAYGKKKKFFFFSDEWVKFIEKRKTIQLVQKEATKAEFIHQINKN